MQCKQNITKVSARALPAKRAGWKHTPTLRLGFAALAVSQNVPGAIRGRSWLWILLQSFCHSAYLTPDKCRLRKAEQRGCNTTHTTTLLPSSVYPPKKKRNEPFSACATSSEQHGKASVAAGNRTAKRRSSSEEDWTNGTTAGLWHLRSAKCQGQAEECPETQGASQKETLLRTTRKQANT